MVPSVDDEDPIPTARRRPKPPFWAMAALSLLPLWAFMYVRAMTPSTAAPIGPMALGEQVYSRCAQCHGARGEGGVGRPFAAGAVLATFPHIEDQLRFVSLGTEAYQAAGVAIYGAPDRPGGPHVAGSFGIMPPQGSSEGGSLTDAEILAVVCHERFALGAADRASGPFADEFEIWCSPESPVFAALESGVALADVDGAGITGLDGAPVEILPVVDQPMEGAPSG